MMTIEAIRQIAADVSGCGKRITLSEAECGELVTLLRDNPAVSEEDVMSMFRLLGRRLSWFESDHNDVRPPLRAFFDAKAERDMDMLSLARMIGHDIRSGCEGCTCRC